MLLGKKCLGYVWPSPVKQGTVWRCGHELGVIGTGSTHFRTRQQAAEWLEQKAVNTEA